MILMVIFLVKNREPDPERFMKALIGDINDSLYQLQIYDHISSSKAYRDGASKGIIIEYIFSEKIDPKKVKTEIAKQNLVKLLRAQKDIAEIAKLGIYFNVIYKDIDKVELVNIKILPEDYN